MPKLPSSADLGRSSPKVGGDIPSYNTGGDPTSSARAISGLGRSIIQTGAQLADVDKYNQDLAARERAAYRKEIVKAQEQWDATETENAVNIVKSQAQELSLGEGGYSRKQGRDAAGPMFIKEYTEKYDDIVEKTIQLYDPRIQDRIRQHLAPVKGQYLGGLMRHTVEQAGKYSASVAQTTVTVESNQAMANWQDPVAQEASFARMSNAIRVEMDRVGTPERADLVIAQTKSAVHANIVETLINNNQVERASSYYLQNKSSIQQDDAKNLEKKLTDESERQAVKETALRNQARGIAHSNLQLRVQRGQAGLGEISRYEKDWDDPVGANQLRHMADVIAEQQARKVKESKDALALVGGALNGKHFLDHRSSEHRKAVETYFAEVEAPALKGQPPEVVGQAIANYAKNTGILPQTVAGQLRGGLRSGNAEQRVQTADWLARIGEANPLILQDFSKEDIALFYHIDTYAKAGQTAARAVQLADEALNQPAPEREARELRYRAEDATKLNLKHLQWELTSGAFTRNLGAITPDFISTVGNSPANVPDRMVGQYEDLVKVEFLRGGNLKIAQGIALKALMNVWGVTYTDEQDPTKQTKNGRWMRLAPELIYKVPGEDGTWIREQLNADVRSSYPIDDKTRITIQEDPLTGRQRYPSYQIKLINEMGEIHTIPGADGKPARFTPIYEKSPAGQKRQKAIEEQMAADQAILEKAKVQRKYGQTPPSTDTKKNPRVNEGKINY